MRALSRLAGACCSCGGGVEVDHDRWRNSRDRTWSRTREGRVMPEHVFTLSPLCEVFNAAGFADPSARFVRTEYAVFGTLSRTKLNISSPGCGGEGLYRCTLVSASCQLFATLFTHFVNARADRTSMDVPRVVSGHASRRPLGLALTREVTRPQERI